MSPAALAGALAGLAEVLGWVGAGDEGPRYAKYILPNPRFPQWGRVVTIIDGELARESDGELLMGLIEACEARGWQWRVRARFPVGTGYWARVDTHPGQLADYPGYEGSADSPAHALSLALLAALGAPAGAGA